MDDEQAIELLNNNPWTKFSDAMELVQTVYEMGAVSERKHRKQAENDRDALLWILKELLECPYQIDDATVSSRGLEETMQTHPHQVVGNMSVALHRVRMAQALIKKVEKNKSV